MANKPARCRGSRWQVVENREDRTILKCISCGARIARSNKKGPPRTAARPPKLSSPRLVSQNGHARWRTFFYWLAHKFCFLVTCEYCTSFWINLVVVLVSDLRILYDDWRGVSLAVFGVPWVAVLLMDLHQRLRVEIRKGRSLADAEDGSQRQAGVRPHDGGTGVAGRVATCPAPPRALAARGPCGAAGAGPGDRPPRPIQAPRHLGPAQVAAAQIRRLQVRFLAGGVSRRGVSGMDDRSLIVVFDSPEIRQHFKSLCGELGHNEHILAKRLLQNFIGYCEEQRPAHLKGDLTWPNKNGHRKWWGWATRLLASLWPSAPS